jgi:hypothetical protein
MADAIEQMIGDPAKREAFAAKGYDLVRKKFDNEKITGELRAIYQTALKSRTFNNR